MQDLLTAVCDEELCLQDPLPEEGDVVGSLCKPGDDEGWLRRSE